MIRADIKICGLRREADALYINDFKEIKYAGFVFAKSKRQVTPSQALEIRKRLRPDIKAVGVFADMPTDRVIECANGAELDIIQLHSGEDRTYILRIKEETNLPVWKSIAVKDRESLAAADAFSDIADGFVLDTYSREVRGGSGRVFNWELVQGFSKKHLTILAGGINEENIADAFKAVMPHIIDLSSAVETDGFKDYKKIESLIRRIK